MPRQAAAIDDLRARWVHESPGDPSFSAGVAEVTEHGGVAALAAADAALMRARAEGGDRTSFA